MPYGTIYRIKYKGVEDEVIVTHICDGDTFSGGAITEYTDLTPTDESLIISVVDDNRDKFTPIRAKKADISFISGSVSAKTFGVGSDNRWYVECFIDSTAENLFMGFLVMDGHEQLFFTTDNIHSQFSSYR